MKPIKWHAVKYSLMARGGCQPPWLLCDIFRFIRDSFVARLKRWNLSEKSCSTSSHWARCTGAGQDSAEQGHAYWCDLCGSSMMKRSAREGCDPPEQLTFPTDRQTLTFVYCSMSTCWDVIIHLNISGKVPQCHLSLTDPPASCRVAVLSSVCSRLPFFLCSFSI